MARCSNADSLPGANAKLTRDVNLLRGPSTCLGEVVPANGDSRLSGRRKQQSNVIRIRGATSACRCNGNQHGCKGFWKLTSPKLQSKENACRRRIGQARHMNAHHSGMQRPKYFEVSKVDPILFRRCLTMCASQAIIIFSFAPTHKVLARLLDMQ